MGTFTVNLHLLMASFYTPTATKNKIILDWKAFPSDHYAVESQIRGHGYNPDECIVMVAPDEGEYEISTQKILSIIDEHASTTALVLLPGIQYYTGQFFDIKTITAYAQSKGLLIGWDLAHAAGNVPLELHDWNVDFAAWCTYKYMNAGPGAIAGLYVHERHGTVDYRKDENKPVFRHRLSGWYGGDQVGRFNMDNSKSSLPSSKKKVELTQLRIPPKSRRVWLPSLQPFSARSCLALRRIISLQPNLHRGYSQEIRSSHRLPRTSPPLRDRRVDQGFPYHHPIITREPWNSAERIAEAGTSRHPKRYVGGRWHCRR